MAVEQDTFVVILAGGQGTRFWPMSRVRKPKQFLSISHTGESLIQATVRRAEDLVGRDRFIIMTHSLYREQSQAHVPFAKIVCEPVARNTAASIGLAAIHAQKLSRDPVLVILPADHAVSDQETFRATLSNAVAVAASNDLLVTVGIKPTVPHTGYGYIRKGRPLAGEAFMVQRFFEKPNLERAVKYFESGQYLWNSGMFMWRASVVLKAIAEFMPELYAGLQKIQPSIGTADEENITKEVFDALESVSIDFGIMEHARNCAVLEAKSFGWNDVGSWDAWAEHFAKDENNNLRYGDALVLEGSNCVVHSQNRLIAVLGLNDLVVIDAGDAMLVCPRDRLQDVRKVVDELKKEGRKELI